MAENNFIEALLSRIMVTDAETGYVPTHFIIHLTTEGKIRAHSLFLDPATQAFPISAVGIKDFKAGKFNGRVKKALDSMGVSLEAWHKRISAQTSQFSNDISPNQKLQAEQLFTYATAYPPLAAYLMEETDVTLVRGIRGQYLTSVSQDPRYIPQGVSVDKTRVIGATYKTGKALVQPVNAIFPGFVLISGATIDRQMGEFNHPLHTLKSVYEELTHAASNEVRLDGSRWLFSDQFSLDTGAQNLEALNKSDVSEASQFFRFSDLTDFGRYLLKVKSPTDLKSEEIAAIIISELKDDLSPPAYNFQNEAQEKREIGEAAVSSMIVLLAMIGKQKTYEFLEKFMPATGKSDELSPKEIFLNVTGELERRYSLKPPEERDNIEKGIEGIRSRVILDVDGQRRALK